MAVYRKKYPSQEKSKKIDAQDAYSRKAQELYGEYAMVA